MVYRVSELTNHLLVETIQSNKVVALIKQTDGSNRVPLRATVNWATVQETLIMK